MTDVKPIKILLADDSTLMRKMLMDILEEAGYTNFVECEDGDSCIQKFDLEAPDLTILDLIMPNKGGLDVLKLIGKRGSKIIIVSVVGQDNLITEARKNGAQAYILKPFVKEDVIATVKRVVSGT